MSNREYVGNLWPTAKVSAESLSDTYQGLKEADAKAAEKKAEEAAAKAAEEAAAAAAAANVASASLPEKAVSAAS